jgi:hypothetical protein
MSVSGEGVNDGGATVDDAIVSIHKCPVAKAFPRYRLDLSSFKKKKQESGFLSFQLPFQKEISQSMALGKVKQQLLTTQAEELIWQPGLDGLAGFSFLWNRASNLLHNESIVHLSEVVALPDASPGLVQNWIEIVEWMNNEPAFEPAVTNTNTTKTSIQVNLLLEEHSIPAVRIQRIGTVPVTSTPQPQVETTTRAKQIQERTRAWVKRILVEQGICPFTKSDRKSGQGLSDVGVPVGSIAYHASFANEPIRLQAETWKAILEMIEAGPSGKGGVSSILLSAPAFDDNFDIWAGPIFAMLEAGVVAARAQAQVGVVCFHPRYATPDGSSWPGFGHMHSVPRLEKWYREHVRDEREVVTSDSEADGEETTCPKSSLTTEEVAAGGAWQRRTPHATINVLRADQLEAAESRRSSGQLYAENIEKLVGKNGIGAMKLSQDLDLERRLGL